MKKKKNLQFYLIYSLFLILFIEVVLRVCYPLPELSNFNRINYQILDVSDNKGEYLRNVKMLWKSFPDTNYAFVHELNTYGFRDKEWKVEKETGKKRVFILGDSFVEGMMSTTDKTIPKAFENEAAEKLENIEVFNCGMMGIGLNEYIKFITDAVPVFRPDELILVLYSNDMPFQREYQPSTRLSPKYYSFLKPRLLEIIEHINSNDPIPMQFMKEEIPFYKAVPDSRNPWTFQEEEFRPHVKPELAEAMKAGNLNYYRTNWYPNEAKFLASPIDIDSKMKFIRNYLNEYKCKLTVYYVPSRLQVSDFYYQFEKQYCQIACPESFSLMTDEYQIHRTILDQTCKQLNIPFKDLSPIVKAEEERGNHLYWGFDDHMRGKGYMLLGKKIYEDWSKPE
ncbi:MAG: SGNH/GDSL hydrolase family protein [Bacteroidetes bacterium]|nr:SGNH/GDSL hydrolase family protein [Bacteroidota bacterium]